MGRTEQAAIADGIEQTKMLLGRYLAGFDDSNHTKQAPHLPNHVAWCLGHLALTMSRLDEKITGRALPASDFAVAADAQHIATESVAFGSKPAADAGKYPGLARCRAIYEAACDRVAGTYRGLPDARLKDTLEWGNAKHPIGALGLRMVFHNGCHTGQIADLRRALGMKSIM